MKSLLAVCAVLSFIACEKSTETPANSPGLRVTLGSCDGKAALKSAVDSALTGTVHFQSRDSLSVTLPVILNCQASYAFDALYRAPDTLAFEARDVGDSRSKCVCDKDVTFEYKATGGENLATVTIAKFDAQVFHLVSE